MSTYVLTDLPTMADGSQARADSRGRSRRSAQLRVHSSSGHLRLTRRGRAMLMVLGLATALAVSVMAGSGSIATTHSSPPAATEIVVVADGDTLWAIASDIAASTGEKDVRTVMSQIETLNALESPMLLAGQQLRVPLIDKAD